MRKNAPSYSFKIHDNLKPPKSVLVLLAIWLLAIGSLLGIHYFLKHRPRIDKAKVMKIEAKLKSQTDEQKVRLKHFESGIIELASGDIFLIDSAMEDKEITERGLSMKKIELVVDDPLFLERQMMVKEASKRLTNAEKRCVIDRHAVILYREGAYYLVYDPEIYKKYVAKYGIECQSCGEKKMINKGEIKNEKMG